MMIILNLLTYIFLVKFVNSKLEQSYSEKVCRNFIYDSEKGKEDCVVINDNMTSTVYQCKEKTHCPFTKYDFSEPKTFSCKADEPEPEKVYPDTEDTCDNENKTCGLGRCKMVEEKNKCVFQNETEECKSITECDYGLTCSEQGKCVKLKGAGEECKEDTDCKIRYGCLNGICVEYFSKNDTIEIQNAKEYKGIDGRRFCSSFYLEDGKTCQTFTLFDKNETHCIYRDRYYRLKYLDTVCGINGNHVCPMTYSVSGFKNFLRYLKLLNINKTNCHTSERFGVCHKDKVSQNNNTKELVKNFELYKLQYDYNNTLENLVEDDKSRRKALFNISTRAGVTNDFAAKKCPKYKCVEKTDFGEICSKSYVTLGEEGRINDITVELIEGVCDREYYCSLRGENPNAIIMLGRELRGRCKPIMNSVLREKYPGEPCEEGEKCYNGDVCLQNKTCPRRKKEEGEKECKDHLDCFAGYFCNSTSATCEPQIDEQGNCTSSYECKNHLVCQNRTCIQMFSLKVGEVIIRDDADGALPSGYFCEFGKSLEFIEENKNKTLKCVKKVLEYDPNKDEIDEFGFKRCNYGSKCIYDVSGVKDVDDCGCGYNSEGYGYCPLGHDKDEEIWRKYFKAQYRKANNNCHTLKRYNCHNSESWALKDITFYSHYLEKGHLFNKAVKCAIDILSGGWIKTNIVLLFILFIIY